MSVILMMGDHPRHWYLAQHLHEAGLLSALVVESRGKLVPRAPKGLTPHLALLFERHFHERRDAEHRHFGADRRRPGVPTLETDAAQLNGAPVTDFLGQQEASLLLTYGVHILSDSTLAAARVSHRWNLHGGLSPWYRGCITHFWPTYLLEPQMTGCTVHELTAELDFGPVVQQSVADLVRGDGVHDLACRAVKKAVAQLPVLCELADRHRIQTVRHRTSGRLWRAADWRPEHLELVYEQFGNRVVDRYLDGDLRHESPKLVVQNGCDAPAAS